MTDASDVVDASEHRHRDLRVSWSALLRWEECRQMEKLHRDGKKVASYDGRIFLPGTVADLSMRKFLEQDNPVRGTLPDMVADILNEKSDNPERPIKWRGGEKGDRAAILNDVQEGMRRLEPWLWENVLPYEYQPEARGYGIVGVYDSLNNELQRVELTVAVDIAVRRDDKYRLYDLKFTKDENYVSGKTLAQLPFYRLGWAAMMGVPLRDIDYLAFITPATKVLEHPVMPDKDDMRYLMARITAYCEGIWSGVFPTKKEKDSFCNYRCDVRRECPLFAVGAKGGRPSLLDAAKAREWKGPVD